MTQSQPNTEAIAAALPCLRRYARALTGSQTSGDRYAAATLEMLLADASAMAGDLSPRLALFRAFHTVWISSGAPVSNQEEGLRARAQDHLSRLTANTREALLLHTVEEFTLAEVGAIMETSEAEAGTLVDIARREMSDSAAGSVLIIEDEAVIALDLQDIIADMGHRIVGVGRTRDEAVRIAGEDRPDLILADIQLADNSSGIDAVNDILEAQGERPVIFITAFPERFLTGTKPEPAFLISKPYNVEQVRSAASQALFFSSTETLSDGSH